MKYYITEWSPNGTNDLLICNNDGRILNVLEKATFGINVDLCTMQGYAAEDFIWLGKEAKKEYLNLEGCGVVAIKKATLKEVKRKLAISPVLNSKDAEARLHKALKRGAQ